MTQPLTDLTDDEVVALIKSAEATVAVAQANLKRLNHCLFERKESEVMAALAKKAEPYGDVKIGIGSEEIKFTCPKKVKWDQDALKTKYAEILDSGDKPEEYIKLEYSVSETSYKAWPQDIKDFFADARTVERGSVSVKIITKEKEGE